VDDELKSDSAVLIQNAFCGLIAWLFYLAPRLAYEVQVRGQEHISGQHPVLIVSNHKRDLDSLILVALSYLHGGFEGHSHPIAFALREDASWRGFLQAYLRLPGLAGRILGATSLRGHLHMLRAFPIGYLTDRRQLERIRGQLQTFANLIDRGYDVYWTPEGGLSLDGRLARFRAGLYRLVENSSAPLKLRPMAVFYDFMTTGRTRCFVRIGPESWIDRSVGRAEFEQEARLAILRQTTINVAHLAVAALREIELPASISREDFERRLLHHAGRYRSAGLALDPRLESAASFRRRLDAFLDYAQSESLLGTVSSVDVPSDVLERGGMSYARNELLEAEAAFGL